MRIRRLRTLAATALLAGVAPPGALAQSGTGVITGRVTEQESGAPIGFARVYVVGTQLAVPTNSSGEYSIRGVSPGAVSVRAIALGFQQQAKPVTVEAGGATSVDFALVRAATQLSEVVATATGEQRRVEVGNAIAQIDAARLVEERPISNFSELLVTRAPGVQVIPGNVTGAMGRVRIRGTNSLALSNDPIYVIDGVRMESSSGSSSIGVGGSLPSRAGDINPEEIESVEVVRGPSAATLYGTDAANGVIVITTKKGRAGRPRWRLYTEQAAISDRNEYPTAYSGYGKLPSGAVTNTCFLFRVQRGECTAQDSVTTYNLFEDDQSSPLKTGHRQQYGLQVSGGSDAVRYFMSGEWEDEQGRYRMPPAFESRLRAQDVPVLDEWLRPNVYRRASGRGNLNVRLGDRADIGLSTSFTTSGQRLPQSDNNTTGLQSNAYGGPGRRTDLSATGDSLYGWRLFTPDRIFQETVTQNVNRFIGALNGNWRPLSWLATRGNFGLDFTSRVDEDLCRFSQCVDFSTYRLGFKTNNRAQIGAYTADVGATATFQPLPSVSSRTTLGTQFFRNVFNRNGAYGEVLVPGGTEIDQSSTRTAEERTQESRTIGAFVEEALAFNDRLFTTLAVRMDDNSAFGKNFSAVYYPKASVSWVLSDEGFFPTPSWLSQLRLRSAWGASGVQPGTTDAARFYIGRSTTVADENLAGFSFGSLGNADLKPERTQEVEAGIDATMWQSRVNVELTFYNKTSRDALVQRVVPGSVGTDSTVVFANIGKVRNRGFEGLVIAQLVDRPTLAWDLTLNGSTNNNKILDLGDLPPIIGNTIDQREGYPLNAYWQRTYTYADANSDGLISAGEVTVTPDRQFVGYSSPRHEVVLANGFEFLDRHLRLAAQFDYKGGHKLYNNTERIRCASRNNCRGLIDPGAPLAEQARVIALRELPGASVFGYMEDASFIRFRELSLTGRAPEGWAARFGASALSATLSARNLAIWTDYTGIDPEGGYFDIAQGSSYDLQSDFQASPPPTLFSLRLNVEF